MMQAIKQKKWWKPSLNVFLSTVLIASSLSFAAIPGKAEASASQAVGPGGVEGAALWLRADKEITFNNSTISAWNDQSGNDRHFTQNESAKQPTFNDENDRLNFNPVVSFDGTNDYLVNMSGVLGNSNHNNLDIFTVANTRTNNGSLFWERTGGSAPSSGPRIQVHPLSVWDAGNFDYPRNRVATGDNPWNKYSIYNFNFEYTSPTENSQMIKRNGKVPAHTPNSVLSNSSGREVIQGISKPLYIGVGYGTTDEFLPSGYYSGQMGEFIVYTKPLNTTERKQIDSYLAIKYGQSLDMIDYLDSNSNAIWQANANYNKNIAGIARDDKSGLYQKQSRATEDASKFTISIGTALSAKNELVDGALNDKQALIWGDNGNNLKFTKQIGSTNQYSAERIWKVQNTSNVGEVLIAVPKDAVPEKSKLLVSSSDTDFTAAIGHALTEDTFEGAVYYTTRVTLQDGQFFTFATQTPELENAVIDKVGVNGNQVTLTFDQEIALTNGAGFTVEVAGAAVVPTEIKVDPTDSKKVIMVLPNGTDVDGKEVKVNYNSSEGNLKGKYTDIPVHSLEKSIADKSQLEAKVTEVTGLTETNYTPATWTDLQDKLTAAQSILNKPGAIQTEIDAALTALKNAQTSLKAPAPTTVALEQTVVGGNKVTLTFNQNVTLTDLEGFTITVGGQEVTPIFTVDPTDSKKIIFTLPDGTEVTNKEVKVVYNGTGTLKGVNGTAVIDFEKVAEDPYNAALQITKPDASVNVTNPTIKGTVHVGTTTPSTVSVVLKDANNQVVDGASGTATVDGSGNWTFTPPTDLADGTYTIVATATDGQQTATKTHTFTVTTKAPVDKSQLQTKVDEGKGLTAGNYTLESWATYKAAKETAEIVLNDPNATQEQVNAALATLTAAQNGLVTKRGGLDSLTTSIGTLNPSFSTEMTNYTMHVGYPTTQLTLTALPINSGATVTMTVNGQAMTTGLVPLAVGANTIVITVTDATGTKQYVITVYRANDNSSGSGSGGTWIPTTPTPTPGETKTKIQVELEIDGEKPLEKTTVEIERTKHANGDITDFVALTEANAKEAVTKAKAIGNDIARIVLPDVNDEVKEAKVDVPKESLKLLRDNGLALEISSENGHIAIPVSSMEGIDDNFYFRLVPVKKESERQAIEERARAERVVRATLQSNDVHVVARPLTIETNMPNRPVQIILPLKGVEIPTDVAEREAFLKQLAVFIEHSDGEKKVVIPEVVTMAKGELGLRFTVEKFSTFTIIQVNKEEETKPSLEVKEHEAYVKGFPDGTFGPEKNVTRAQVATMIARILGYTDDTANIAPFKDTPSDHYAVGAIAFVKERGIMNGDVNGNFRASENITRAQMATVVANFKQLHIEEKVAITFNDTKGHWAQWIIEANRTAGIINGRQNGSFAPDEHLTRAQAVVMMNRMFERGPLNGVTEPSFPDVKATHWAFKEIEEAAKPHSYVINEDDSEQLSK